MFEGGICRFAKEARAGMDEVEGHLFRQMKEPPDGVEERVWRWDNRKNRFMRAQLAKVGLK